jgi:hypothetical protein
LKAIDTLAELEDTFAGFLQKQELSHTVYSLKAAIDSLFDGTAHIAHASESVTSSVEEPSSAVGRSPFPSTVTNNLNFLADAINPFPPWKNACVH